MSSSPLPIDAVLGDAATLFDDTDEYVATLGRLGLDESVVVATIEGLIGPAPYEERRFSQFVWLIVGLVAGLRVAEVDATSMTQRRLRIALLDANAMIQEHGRVGACARAGVDLAALEMFWSCCAARSPRCESYGVPGWVEPGAPTEEWIDGSVAALLLGVLASGRLVETV
ncbi:MAG TPA: hypothetical protein VNS09_26255 [Solirubrobacter sp.]|nr:hypothetical protein [Solirubrobacter sp.]